PLTPPLTPCPGLCSRLASPRPAPYESWTLRKRVRFLFRDIRPLLHCFALFDWEKTADPRKQGGGRFTGVLRDHIQGRCICFKSASRAEAVSPTRWNTTLQAEKLFQTCKQGGGRFTA